MKKINWKLRFSNPLFWAQIFFAFAAPLGSYYGIKGRDIDTWPALFDLLGAAALNPFVVFTVFVVVFAAVTDPTTPGVEDSKRALTYTTIKKELK